MKILWSLYFFFKASLLPCGHDVEQGFERGRRYYRVEPVARLDPRVDESSGLVFTDRGTMLSHNDSGGASAVYELDASGRVVDSVQLDAPNVDWEDLALSPSGDTLFVADIGNNRNRRRNLRIYAFQPGSGQLDTLPIAYADQQAFPPPPEAMRFDGESMVLAGGALHFFSKNRGTDYGVRHYALGLDSAYGAPAPLRLSPSEQITLYKQQVTSAAVSPDGALLALLTYGRIYLFRLDGGEDWLGHPWRVIKCNRMGQSEGVGFAPDGTLHFTNEQGKLFRVSLNRRGRAMARKAGARPASAPAGLP
jgi:sugar lactone lactonase YvrE